MNANTRKKNQSADLILKISAASSEAEINLLRQLFYPSRINALMMIHECQSISVPELSAALGLKNHAVQVTLDVLQNLGLVTVDLEINPGHGMVRIARTNLSEKAKAIGVELSLRKESKSTKSNL